MFDALEKARARDARRLTPADVRPPEIHTANDIRRVLVDYDPANEKAQSPVQVKTRLRGEDAEGHMQVYEVSASTTSRSRRAMLLEGFEVLKRQAGAKATISEKVEPIPVNGLLMAPPQLPDDSGLIFIDPLIKRWMNAERRGMLICWDLDDGYTYRYEIYEHKLSRVKQDATAS